MDSAPEELLSQGVVIFRRDTNLDSDVESLLRYTHSGFHPVRPGDVYRDGHYKVIRKLGHGGYSTVWLSEEIAYCYLLTLLLIGSTGRAVALKVHAAKAGYRELNILLRLKEKSSYPENIIKLLDHFEHTGPNGLHLCLVLELMLGDVNNFMGGIGRYAWPKIRAKVTKEVAKQVLKGLQVLGQLGITHNG
jgi:serine/threonine-protein kinase SRPK3